jgi:hypothetical protein
MDNDNTSKECNIATDTLLMPMIVEHFVISHPAYKLLYDNYQLVLSNKADLETNINNKRKRIEDLYEDIDIIKLKNKKLTHHLENSYNEINNKEKSIQHILFKLFPNMHGKECQIIDDRCFIYTYSDLPRGMCIFGKKCKKLNCNRTHDFNIIIRNSVCMHEYNCKTIHSICPYLTH